jgi:Flp pilus assembly protein TadG
MFKNEKGQSMVEMALLLPLLLLLITGIFDIGRLMYTYMHLQIATQETVRQGGLGMDDSEITSFARNYVNIQDPNQLDVQISPGDTERKSGDYVTVTLEYPIEFITPFVSNVIPSPVQITTDSTIRVE